MRRKSLKSYALILYRLTIALLLMSQTSLATLSRPGLKVPKSFALLEQQVIAPKNNTRQPSKHQKKHKKKKKNKVTKNQTPSENIGKKSKNKVLNSSDPEEIIERLLAGDINPLRLSINQTYIALNYIRQPGNSDRFHDEKYRPVLHKINIAYQKTPAGRINKQKTLTKLGSEPASDFVQKKVRKYLRKVGCITADTVEIRQLRDDHFAAGVTSAHGIWVKKEGTYDMTFLLDVCAHEAGHWFHQHHWLALNKKRREREAEEFAFYRLTKKERMDIYTQYATGKLKHKCATIWIRLGNQYPSMLC
jgi:hypothetical protein